MATKRKFKSDAFEANHSFASVLHRVDAISEKAMREFDESCRTTADINSTPSNRTPDRVKGINDDAFFDPLHEAELVHWDVQKGGEGPEKNNDVSKTEPKSNLHSGSSFDDFLKGEGIFDEVHAKALGRALAEAAGENEKPSAYGEVKARR